MATQASSIPELMTVKQFAAAHPWVTEKALRGMIFTADAIGFSKCVLRIRGKVLIDVAAFARWIEGQNKPKEPPIPFKNWRRKTRRVGKENCDGPP